MIEAIVAFVAEFPAWLAVILLSMIPVTELRVTIPVAVASWGMHPLLALILGTLGASIPFFPIYFGFMSFRNFAAAHAPWLTRWLDRLLAKGQARYGKKFSRYELIALILFVAIPFPGTGVWAGSVAAVAMKLPFNKAALAVLGGALQEGVIMLILTLLGVAVLA